MADTDCLYCSASNLGHLIDFGVQPLTNRWPVSAIADEYRFRLMLGQCGACGVVQLLDPPPPEEIRSRYDWLNYNEPEGHLDDVVGRIMGLPGVSPASVVAGTSYKEDTTLARLNRRGWPNTWRLELSPDLAEHDLRAGLETIQQRLTPETAEAIAACRGRPDVLFVRHIIEHAQQPRRFAEAVSRLAKPDGYVLFEIPDCTRSLKRHDYSMPWEEHVAYFTPGTFRTALTTLGFDVLELVEYEYSHENSLVAFCKTAPRGADDSGSSPTDLGVELQLGAAYGEAFPRVRTDYQTALGNFRRNHGKIAALGAGHLAATFINVLGLAELLDCVVDDNPQKQGLFMPGSKLPIVPSSALVERDIRLCLLSVNPEVEAKVRQKNAAFEARGGRWMSMFTGRPTFD